MDKEIVKVLRNRSFVDGKEKTWISSLTDKQLWDITIKLINRVPLTEIAKHIKKRGWTKSESSVRSISQGISKYANRIVDVLILTEPVKIEDVGASEGLKSTRKVLMQSIRTKGPANRNLAKESKVLLEINNAIERLKEQEKEARDPKNFIKIAGKIISNLNEENTKKYVEAVLNVAELKLKKALWLNVLDDPPDMIMYNSARKRYCTLMQRLMYIMNNEPEKLGEVKIKNGDIDERGIGEFELVQTLHDLLNQFFLSEVKNNLQDGGKC